MDSHVDSAIGINGSMPFRKWNRYIQDVPKPTIEINYGLDIAEAHRKSAPSFLASTIQEAFNEVSSELADVEKSHEVLNDLADSIDPFLRALLSPLIQDSKKTRS